MRNPRALRLRKTILERAELEDMVWLVRLGKRSIALTAGRFDVVDAAVAAFLYELHERADVVMVGVQGDAWAKPVFPLPSRMLVLAAMSAVDYVFPYFAAQLPSEVVAIVAPEVLLLDTYAGA